MVTGQWIAMYDELEKKRENNIKQMTGIGEERDVWIFFPKNEIKNYQRKRETAPPTRSNNEFLKSLSGFIFTVWPILFHFYLASE